MKHGPLALVDEHMPVLAVATRDAMWGKMQSVIAQLLARKSQLIVMCNEGDAVTKELCASHGCQVIEVGSELLSAIRKLVSSACATVTWHVTTVLACFMASL